MGGGVGGGGGGGGGGLIPRVPYPGLFAHSSEILREVLWSREQPQQRLVWQRRGAPGRRARFERWHLTMTVARLTAGSRNTTSSERLLRTSRSRHPRRSHRRGGSCHSSCSLLPVGTPAATRSCLRLRRWRRLECPPSSTHCSRWCPSRARSSCPCSGAASLGGGRAARSATRRSGCFQASWRPPPRWRCGSVRAATSMRGRSRWLSLA